MAGKKNELNPASRPLGPVTAAHLVLRHYQQANEENGTDVRVPFSRICDLSMIFAGYSHLMARRDPFPDSRIYITENGPRYRELTLANFKKDGLDTDIESNRIPVAIPKAEGGIDQINLLTRVFLAFGFASENALDEMFRGDHRMCAHQEVGDRAKIEDISYYLEAYGEAAKGDVVLN